MPDKQTADNSLKVGQGKPGPGRPKGSVNRVNRVLKDAILEAAERAGDGDLVAFLTEQAKTNPTAFLTLLGKVLPMTVAGDSENPVRTITRIELVAPGFDERAS